LCLDVYSTTVKTVQTMLMFTAEVAACILLQFLL